MVEETFKRSLTPLELEIILDWSANGENPISVQQALAMATSANKLNIKYIDSCLAAIKKDSSEDEVVLNEAQTKLLNDFLEQKEKFEDIESVVNASSTLNRELYVGGISDEMSGGLEAIIRFWTRLDEQEGIPVAERKPIKLYIDSWGGELVSCYTIVNNYCT